MAAAAACPSPSAGMAAAACPSPSAALPAFQFRARRDSPDWRRLSSVDLERVASGVEVAVLQEHLEQVTFCNAARERCPRCQAPADPLLLKLLRLAQLSLEYLLHSQDYLSAQVRAGQELLRAADAHRDLLAKDVARGAQEIRLLKEECRRRKKTIATQQMMLQAGAVYHQCQFCDKAFMNNSFLRSHLQRRHSEEPLIDQKKKTPTDKFQEEISKLKEQLQLTRSQLEAEQHAHLVKLAKEYEERRSKEEAIQQFFHKWKEEEKEKLASELEKVKEMFMKEFKELTAKNSELEKHLIEVQKSNKNLKSNLGTLKDSYELAEEKNQIAVEHQNIMQLLEKQETKWTSKLQSLQEEHEKEKHQLTSQIEKLKASVAEDLSASNIFYKKRIEELGQKLQEQNDLIVTQKHQIEKLASKKSMEILKSSEVKTSTQNVRPKSSLSSTREIGKVTAHKRSASWNSMDHRREIAKLKQQLQRTKLGAWNGREKDQSPPIQGNHSVVPSAKASPPASFPVLTTVSISPCLHTSFDGINQELEEVFVKEQGDEELLRILDVPDGHRAPAPLQRGAGDALLPWLENSGSSCSSLSLSPSPSAALGQSPHTLARITADEPWLGTLDKPVLEAKGKEKGSRSPVFAFALSPRPNHTYVFKREPPEGCEKIHAFEEVVPDQPVLPSCPDKNKVHFNPTGTAFCQFSLVKPLIPTVDFLFRDFSSSPSAMPPGSFASCQATTTVPILTLQKDSRGDNFSENPKSPSVGLESWKRHQPEDTVLFHSSLVV